MFDRVFRSASVLLTALALAACTGAPPSAGDAVADGADAVATGETSIDAPTAPDDVAPQPDASGEEGSTPSEGGAPGTPTYWRDVAPVLNSRCVSCHTAGGIGPMALTTYAEARTFAPLIAMETAAKRMPPYLADASDCRSLQSNPRLTDAQIAMLSDWARMGAPEGNRGDYVEMPAVGPARPLPATADFTVSMPQPYTPNFMRAADDTRCFVVDPQLTQTRDVVGFHVLPGNPRIVHHVILYEVRQGALSQLNALEARDPQPGYECFGSPGIDINARAGTGGDLVDFDAQWVGLWAPGSAGGLYPIGTGIRVKPGSRLVMEIHYNRTTVDVVGMSDQTRVQLYYSATLQPRQAFWLPIANAGFRVPAGAAYTDPRATSTDTLPVSFPLQVYGFAPHMHVRGYSMRAEILSSAGTSQCLMNVPRWNFGWQHAYWLSSPWRLNSAAATRDTLRYTCVWDNTEANQPVIDGVRVPPHELRWGESTDAEMCLLMVYGAL